MKKNILEYTIRVEKKQPSFVYIAIKDWPTYTQPFTFWSQKEGCFAVGNGYYYSSTRLATEKEKKTFESEIKQFIKLYSDEYSLNFVERF